MFGKPARETPKPETTPAIPELKLPENFTLDSDRPETKSLAKTTQDSLRLPKSKMETENSELVNNVEKISRVVSPYFIAIAGLSLYKDNFFLGTILIGVGILSLLKVSAKDVALFLEWLKNFLGFSDEEN
jgi:hypothetical protein